MKHPISRQCFARWLSRLYDASNTPCTDEEWLAMEAWHDGRMTFEQCFDAFAVKWSRTEVARAFMFPAQ